MINHNFVNFVSRVIIYSFLTVFILGVFTPPVFAIEYGGIGGRPAFPREDNPRTDSIFIHTVEKGQVQEDGIRVVNNTNETKTITVYGVDSVPSTDGAFSCAQKADPQKDVGTWITLEKNEVVLKPFTNEVVLFDINVPENVDVGEHNGCIVMQEKKADEGADKPGIQLSFRTGLRVALLVPGDIVRSLELKDFTVTPRDTDDGSFVLQPKVQNTGNVSIDADVKVVTKSMFGTIHEEHGGEFPVLRGELSTWNFILNKPFWGGWYTSQPIISYDSSNNAGVGVDTGGKLTVLKGKEVRFFSTPTTLGLIIEIGLLILVLLILFMIWIAQKRRRWIRKEWIEYTIKDGDDIKKIAERFDISWKLLVKANKLQPPYALDAGTKITVPPEEKPNKQ